MPGIIINEILALIQKRIPRLKDIIADKIVIGPGYTASQLSTGHAGVCFSFDAEMVTRCCQTHKKAGTLAGTLAVELAKMTRSWDLGEAVIGLATLNALSSIYIEKNQTMYVLSKGNVLDHIKFKKDDVVVIVGNILPLRERISGKVKKVYVLERDLMRREDGVLSDTASEEMLPKADIAIITGTTLANGTIDRLLELSRNSREVAVVGASASVLPDPLFDHGATLVGGIRVLDSNKLFQIVAEGGGTKQLKQASEYVNLRMSSSQIDRGQNKHLLQQCRNWRKSKPSARADLR